MPIDVDLNLDLNYLEYEDMEAPRTEHNTTEETGVHGFNDDTLNNMNQIDLNQLPCVDVESDGSSSRRDEPEQHPLSEEEVDISLEGESNNAVDFTESGQMPRSRGFLTNDQRKAISHLLLDSNHEGKLKRGTTTRIASLYGVHKTVIERIWRQLKETGDAAHRKTKNCGRKRINLVIESLREIPFLKRQTLRSLSSAMNISKSALSRMVKNGDIRRCSSAIKPHLKEENMMARLRFCISMLEESSIPHDPKFKSMHNVVHIDEKWFYLKKKTMTCYLHPNEDEPYRTCKNKNFIVKIMFLVAVARPRFDDEGKETFSGKIGVFPLVYEQEARRTSANRVAGTLEKKPITSVTKEVCKKWLIEKVLPAIKDKWPIEDLGKTIFIQQDNARCHVHIDDEDFCRVANEDGFDIRLTFQPPNSPDLNVLDLGFFRAIQSLQQKEAANSVESLIETVEKSFEEFSIKNSEKIFLTLQANMIEIMKSKGSNNHKLPHLRKDVEHKDTLPMQLSCESSLVVEVLEMLQ